MHLIDIRARAQSLAPFLSWKILVLPNFLDFSSCVGWSSNATQTTAKIFSRQFSHSTVQVLRPIVTAHSVLHKSIDCETSEEFTYQFHNFFWKKQSTVNWQIQVKEGRFLQEDAQGEPERVTKDKQTSYCFQHSKMCKHGRVPVGRSDAPSLTQTLIIQSVYWHGSLWIQLHRCSNSLPVKIKSIIPLTNEQTTVDKGTNKASF